MHACSTYRFVQLAQRLRWHRECSHSRRCYADAHWPTLAAGDGVAAGAVDAAGASAIVPAVAAAAYCYDAAAAGVAVQSAATWCPAHF